MDTSGIRPSEHHPWYWEYDGEPVLLLGGSDTDNLFQWADAGLTEQLDRLVENGGNYVRNTMSDRGDSDTYAFVSVRDGTYDLERWNETYWNKLETFLEETAKRDVVVQLTLWDQHDLSGEWDDHPWNPFNNVTYGRYESGLSDSGAFFLCTERNDVVYPYLERFVDRILDVSLEYGHVLYNVNNESWAGELWETQWAEHIQERAAERGTEAYVTNMTMWSGNSVESVCRNPNTFSFVELSQINQNSKGEAGQAHWDAVQSYRTEVGENLGPRPLNHVKIYGTDEENLATGSAQDAIERLWRNVVGGCASARFHRPIHWGIGLTERARPHIASAREVAEAMDVFSLVPQNDLLIDRAPNEAYCAASSDEALVYAPDGASVRVETDGRFGQARWLDADSCTWAEEAGIDGDPVTLSPPGDDNWVAVLSE